MWLALEAYIYNEFPNKFLFCQKTFYKNFFEHGPRFGESYLGNTVNLYSLTVD